MEKRLRVLGIAGSLRKSSFNRALLRAAAQLVPKGMDIESFDLAGIPPFNQDFENDMPGRVQEFKSKILDADGILFVTPEANYSIPGVLKNAIDWASRPYGANAFKGKPAAIMSASTSSFGGARAQYHLRQTFVYLEMNPLNVPEVMVANASEKFEEDGRFNDDEGKKLVAQLLESFRDWIIRLG